MAESNRSKATAAAAPSSAHLTFAQIQDPEVSPRSCQVFWALTYWAWGRKAECWPTNRQVADLIGCSPRTIGLALTELAKRGHIYRKMVTTRVGTHRVITLAERYQPTLAIVEPAGGGRAIGCATPVDGNCATPLKDLARPPAQDPAPKKVLEFEGEKRELSPPSSLEEPGTSARGPAEPEKPAEPTEPAWLEVDQLTPEDVASWQQRADQLGPRDPMGKIARKILDRWARKNAASGGSPAKDPHQTPLEGDCPVSNFYQKPAIKSSNDHETQHNEY